MYALGKKAAEEARCSPGSIFGQKVCVRKDVKRVVEFGNLHEVGFQQVLTSADILCIHKGQPTGGLHLVHHRQQLTDLLHLVAPLALALFMLMALVMLSLHSQLGIGPSILTVHSSKAVVQDLASWSTQLGVHTMYDCQL